MPRPRRLTALAVRRSALAAAALLSLAACQDDPAAPATPSTSFHGLEPSSTVLRPSWTLTDTDGKPFDFAAQTKGKVTFVYYGYVNCPDECPTAMADIHQALQKQPELAKDVRVVFVTTDPARDTGPKLRRFLDQWDPSFIGVRGTAADVAKAQLAAGVAAAYPEGPVPTLSGNPTAHPGEASAAPHKHFEALGYAVRHSAVIFAYDAADRLPVVYPGGVTPSDIAADLPVLASARTQENK